MIRHVYASSEIASRKLRAELAFFYGESHGIFMAFDCRPRRREILFRYSFIPLNDDLNNWSKYLVILSFSEVPMNMKPIYKFLLFISPLCIHYDLQRTKNEFEMARAIFD